MLPLETGQVVQVAAATLVAVAEQKDMLAAVAVDRHI